MDLFHIFVLIAAVIGGGYYDSITQKHELSGVESRLPLGIIIAYAMGPIQGFLASFAVLAISFLFFPYPLHYVGFTTISLALTFLLVFFFPANAANFGVTALMMAMAYGIISNTFLILFAGYAPFKAARFMVLLALISIFIFIKLNGWKLVLFFS